MSNRKWFINLSILVALSLCFFAFSGFYYEECSKVSIEVDEGTKEGTLAIGIADGSDTDFICYSISDTADSAEFRVYVTNGKTVDIPVTIYIDYDDSTISANNHSIIFNEENIPCSYIEYNEKNVVSGTFHISYAATTLGQSSSFSFKVVYTANGTETELYSNTVYVNTVACANCHGCGAVADEDGNIDHLECSACSGKCTGSGIVHEKCAACGSECCGEGLSHRACPGCGAKCIDGVVTHIACPGCGGECDGKTVMHEKCSSCGGECIGDGVSHKKCEICGVECSGNGITHMQGYSCCEVSPPTGDFTGMYPLLLIFAGSLMVLAGLIFMKKRIFLS